MTGACNACGETYLGNGCAQKPDAEFREYLGMACDGAKPSLSEQLRERTALRYGGDCKCGRCQLVPREMLDRAIRALKGAGS